MQQASAGAESSMGHDRAGVLYFSVICISPRGSLFSWELTYGQGLGVGGKGVAAGCLFTSDLGGSGKEGTHTHSLSESGSEGVVRSRNQAWSPPACLRANQGHRPHQRHSLTHHD